MSAIPWTTPTTRPSRRPIRIMRRLTAHVRFFLAETIGLTNRGRSEWHAPPCPTPMKMQTGSPIALWTPMPWRTRHRRTCSELYSIWRALRRGNTPYSADRRPRQLCVAKSGKSRRLSRMATFLSFGHASQPRRNSRAGSASGYNVKYLTN